MENDIIKKIKVFYPKLYFVNSVCHMTKLEPEDDRGHIEYKRTLIECNSKKEQHYATQMRWRILNSRNQCATYFIGVDDDGSIIGLDETSIVICINKMITISKSINASISRVEIMSINGGLYIIKINVKNKKINDNYLVEFDT